MSPVYFLRRLFFLTVLCAAKGALAAIYATNLLCDAWQNPLGVDSVTPRLSWQLQTTIAGERAQSQTAFQILVASSTNLLANNQGDLWDSGKMISSAISTNYSGTTLASAQPAFWKVCVWDKNNQVSAWSPVATWTMGLLNQSDWQGGWLVGTNSSAFTLTGCNWIWYPEGNPASSAPVATRYFRKSVSRPRRFRTCVGNLAVGGG